ncbi:DUF6215 domain-containing protein [Streptomyces fagopyri]|uniref:DUF6215 domain-containing protein n=1 Tax=Streptomyces fagopyri TaxID=2662397 RepID=UPI0033CAD14B
MLGLILRVLPFWVREPLLIVLGSVLGVRLIYLAVHDQELVPAGFGALFLVFTAVRVHMVVRALRVRRNPPPPQGSTTTATVSPAVPTDGTVVDAAAQAGAEPSLRPAPSEKEHHPWRQAFAAVALFGALGAMLWVAPHVMPSANSTPKPASCSDGEREALPKAYEKTPRPVTGEELCKALNRPDLAAVLGTPGETATTASGSNNTALLTDGKVAEPEAEVAFDTYTVNVSATYNDLSIGQEVKLMKFGDEKDVKTLTVLGRPAVYSSSHTMKLEINLGSGGSGGPVEQGPLARTLTVALDRKDRGGSYDITVWSKSGALPDDGVLVDVAEKVLPTIPDRSS